MPENAPENFNWRTVHSIVVLGVLGLFLYSVHSILNPFVLFLLLVFVISPYSGTRHHLLIVTAAAVLMFVWVLNTTGFLLAPFVLALVLAYIQHPLVARMEGKRLFGKVRISRGLATAMLALPGLGLIALIVFFAVPALSAEMGDLIRRTPDYVRGFTVWLQRWERQLATNDYPVIDEQSLIRQLHSIQPDAVMAWLQERQSAIAQAAWRGILGLGRGLGTILSILSYVVLTPILTFYLLRDWSAIEARMTGLLPGPHRDRVVGFAREYDRLLAAYLRGQVVSAAIVGALTWLGFAIAGFPYALLLGVIAGVFNVIPYMGLVASAIPAVVIALFSGQPVRFLITIVVVFAIVNLLESAVISPKVVGESVGLHPVWVLLALAVCGFFFGFVGLLIAVPLAVLVKLLLETALERYRTSRLFRGERPIAALE
jgi:predicted PurR-regulated permease PerM